MTEGEELGQKSVEREKNSGVYCWSFERGGLEEGGNEEGSIQSVQLNLDLQPHAWIRLSIGQEISRYDDGAKVAAALHEGLEAFCPGLFLRFPL